MISVQDLSNPFWEPIAFKCDMIPEVVGAEESIPSSQTEVRELSRKAHQRGLELPS